VDFGDKVVRFVHDDEDLCQRFDEGVVVFPKRSSATIADI